MSDVPHDVAAALADLRARLERVEAATGAAGSPGVAAGGDAPGTTSSPVAGGRADPAGDGAAGAVPAEGDGTFWLLDALGRNTGPAFSRDGVAGSVAYGGRVAAPGAGEIVWQLEHAVPDVVDADLDRAATVLAALGHPFRLRLLRRLLLGASTLAELQDPTDGGTTGQIHHHLRELRSAGLVVSRRRNRYEIPPERVVPVLILVTAALGREIGTLDDDEDDR